MNKYRIYSSFTLIVLAFSTAIVIIEFILYNNQNVAPDCLLLSLSFTSSADHSLCHHFDFHTVH